MRAVLLPDAVTMRDPSPWPNEADKLRTGDPEGDPELLSHMIEQLDQAEGKPDRLPRALVR
jgi:hypothetical protein